jgi:hypothetical protein
MAVRRPLIQIAGQVQELPSGDTLPGASGTTISTVEIDFGTLPVYSKTFDLNVTCSLNQPVIVSVSLNMPVGVDLDELEMDSIELAAHCTATNNLKVIATSRSPVTGKRNINYILG